MRVFAARFQPHGENCVNETASGAAVWLPPGATFTPEDDARFETALVTAAAPTSSAPVSSPRRWAVHPSDPHHYLMLLGVVPARQGTGVGSALLRAVLDIADAAGEPAYLEATTPQNRALYERHGFEVTRELRAADCPPVGDVAGPGVTLKGVTGISHPAYGSFSSIWSPLQNVPGS